MKIIKLITIILPMIFLISCKTKIICGQINSARIVPVMLYDVSFQFNRCRGRCFDVNEWKTLPINRCIGELDSQYIPVIDNAINYPLEYCDGVAGFSLDDMSENIRPKVKELNAIKGDYCNN